MYKYEILYQVYCSNDKYKNIDYENVYKNNKNKIIANHLLRTEYYANMLFHGLVEQHTDIIFRLYPSTMVK